MTMANGSTDSFDYDWLVIGSALSFIPPAS